MRFSILLILSVFLMVVGCEPHGVVKSGETSTNEETEVRTDLRLLLETRSEAEPDAVTDRLSDYFDSPVRVERLFADIDTADDPEGLARMFLAHVPTQSDKSPWDTAYALSEDLGFERVEPDRERTLEVGLESAGTCNVDSEPPVDRHWSLAKIRAPSAWELDPPPEGSRFGQGIRVCHPDTGWSYHDELPADRLDLSHALNLLNDGTPDAKDPLNYEGASLHPGHGTATGTVIVSPLDGEIGGVAQGAMLVPIRTARSVVQILDSDLARAIYHSVGTGCDVISMSLGGRAFFGLKAAIRHAVRKDVLVMAAAGNCVSFVVAPAAYDSCLAIGGSNIDDKPWRGSSRGKAVDVSAPAEHVWSARRRPRLASTSELYAGQGTSFAVANVAGAAALWLAYHGPETLRTRYLDVPLQEVFREQLARSAFRPDDWDTEKLGAGILDVEALLLEPLPEREELSEAIEGAPLPEAEALVDLSRIVDRPPQEMVDLMAKLFQTPVDEVFAKVDHLAPELIQLALEDPPGFERMLRSLASPEESAALHAGEVLTAASKTLRLAVQ